MRKFIFIVHDHQPIGNFDSVFEDAFEGAYKPFLDTAAKYEKFKFAIHYSGPLLRWLVKNKPKFIDAIKELISDDRVEILGGSFAESILPVWSEKSSKMQLEYMKELVFGVFGVEPVGIWLAERAWEPSLPSIISPFEYVVLDDIHLKRCGYSENDIVNNIFVADNNFAKVKLIASNEVLRYSIPFKEPMETMNYINQFSEEAFLVFADDGEKFGIWPGTYDWVYKQKWLEQFLDLILNNLEMVLPKDLSAYPAKRANPPAGSYTELGEWALPYDAQVDYDQYINNLKSFNIYENKKHFIQGGTWRNFFAKYDESNNMHKRILFAENFLDFNESENVKKFLDAQCNDSYWHGIFGGLYMPHLRNAVYEKIIGASFWHQPMIAKDIDNDFRKEYILSNDFFNVFIKPNYSASIFEFDIKAMNFNILNTIRRQKEFYHTKINHRKQNSNIESIHSEVVAKDENLDEFIFYDKNNRYCFVDHFTTQELTPKEVFECSFNELNTILDYKAKAFDYSVHLENTEYSIRKVYTIGNRALTLDIYNSFEKGILYEELNFTFLSAWDDKQIIINDKTYKMDSFIEIETENILFIDNFRKLFLNLSFTPSKAIIVPIYSVSLSESGIERLYQQTCLFLKCDQPMFTISLSLL